MVKNKKANLDTFDVIILSIAILMVTGLGVFLYHEATTDYEMPNGIICKDIISGQTKTFMSCSDNQKYINPEFYREIKR